MLRLYVWEGVLCDYTCGVMFALAESAKQAREKIIEAARREGIGSHGIERIENELRAGPRVVKKPRGFCASGGG